MPLDVSESSVDEEEALADMGFSGLARPSPTTLPESREVHDGELATSTPRCLPFLRPVMLETHSNDEFEKPLPLPLMLPIHAPVDGIAVRPACEESARCIGACMLSVLPETFPYYERRTFVEIDEPPRPELHPLSRSKTDPTPQSAQSGELTPDSMPLDVSESLVDKKQAPADACMGLSCFAGLRPTTPLESFPSEGHDEPTTSRPVLERSRTFPASLPTPSIGIGACMHWLCPELRPLSRLKTMLQ